MNITDFVASLTAAFRDIGTDISKKADLVSGKVPLSQLPAQATGDFVARSEMGAASGVATLDASAIINTSQLPNTALTTDIPTSQKGVANGVASLGSDGKVPSAQLPTIGSGTGELNRPNFVEHYGGNGDGATNNNAAFTSAEAGTYKQIWLPEGRFLTTLSPFTLYKQYIGPGIIQFSTIDNTDNRPRTNSRVYKKVWATSASDTVNIGTNEPLAQDFGNIEYVTIPAGSRSDLDRWGSAALPPNGRPKYYWAPAIPHCSFFQCYGGESGLTGSLAAPLSVGATSATITGGVVGWNVGDVVGFIPNNVTPSGGPGDGVALDTKTLTGVNTSNGTISWSGGLANAYSAGYTVTKGYRTANMLHFMQVEAAGGGDIMGIFYRGRANRTPLASQNNFSFTASVGFCGGDFTAYADYNMMEAIEWQFIDQGHPTAVFHNVNSYFRTNKDGSRGLVWIHDLCKMDNASEGNALWTNPNSSGLWPMDGIYVAKLQARVGIDFTDSRFSVAAIALAKGQSIGFFANRDWTPADSTNGNGWVATKVGGSIFGSSDATGDFLSFLIHAPGGGGGGGGNWMHLRPNGLEMNKDLCMTGTGKITFNTFESSNYISCDGSHFYFYIGGQLRYTI